MYIARSQWRRLVKNIGGKPQIVGGKCCKKLISAWAFPDFGGRRAQAAPKVYAYAHNVSYSDLQGLR